MINKPDPALLVGADPSAMDRDARVFILANLKEDKSVAEIADFIPGQGGASRRAA